MNISEFPWKSHPFILNHVFQNAHNHNKTISDDKYLAPPHASDWQCSPIKIENGTFDDMTHFLMSSPTFWRQVCFLRHDELFVVMKYLGLHDKLFYIMTYFLLHDKLLTLWQTFLRQTFWHHDVFLTSWCLFDILTIFFLIMTNLLSSWHVFDIMTKLLTSWRNFWRHDNVHTMTNSLTFVISWWTVWRHDVFLRHSKLYDVMTLFTSWRTFWRHDMFLT